ncbi:MAG: type II toxin-antitoxin system RelE/ParE family toxin [Propionibacteriaceae bacterium]
MSLSDVLQCNEIGDSTLDVQYKNNKLRKLCTNQREMQRRRPDIQRKLRLRMNALRAADALGDLPENDPGGDWHDLKGKRAGIWAGELSGNWRILVEPSPLNSLSAARATVIEIEDYH